MSALNTYKNQKIINNESETILEYLGRSSFNGVVQNASRSSFFHPQKKEFWFISENSSKEKNLGIYLPDGTRIGDTPSLCNTKAKRIIYAADEKGHIYGLFQTHLIFHKPLQDGAAGSFENHELTFEARCVCNVGETLFAIQWSGRVGQDTNIIQLKPNGTVLDIWSPAQINAPSNFNPWNISGFKSTDDNTIVLLATGCCEEGDAMFMFRVDGHSCQYVGQRTECPKPNVVVCDGEIVHVSDGSSESSEWHMYKMSGKNHVAEWMWRDFAKKLGLPDNEHIKGYLSSKSKSPNIFDDKEEKDDDKAKVNDDELYRQSHIQNGDIFKDMKSLQMAQNKSPAKCKTDNKDKEIDKKNTESEEAENIRNLFFIEFYNVRIPCDRRLYEDKKLPFKAILDDIIIEARAMFKTPNKKCNLPKLGALACMHDESIVAVPSLRALHTMMINGVTVFTPVFTRQFANTTSIVKLTKLWSAHGLFISREVLRSTTLRVGSAEEFSSIIMRNLLEYVVKGMRHGESGIELMKFFDIIPHSLDESQINRFFDNFKKLIKDVVTMVENKKVMASFLHFLQVSLLTSRKLKLDAVNGGLFTANKEETDNAQTIINSSNNSNLK